MERFDWNVLLQQGRQNPTAETSHRLAPASSAHLRASAVKLIISSTCQKTEEKKLTELLCFLGCPLDFSFNIKEVLNCMCNVCDITKRPDQTRFSVWCSKLKHVYSNGAAVEFPLISLPYSLHPLYANNKGTKQTCEKVLQKWCGALSSLFFYQHGSGRLLEKCGYLGFLNV